MFEELGNERELASSHHQLGNLAYSRGNRTEAKRRYRQALAIFEELGDRAGIARCQTMPGDLSMDTDRPNDAVRLHIQAFAARLDIGTPHARDNLDSLLDLRTTMGDAAFAGACADVLDQENYAALSIMLDDLAGELLSGE
ncbi:tetratricopeptide repeat protein [Dactylosporangium darangshiense]|uniref:tetratricopeptide repeat protein n=1 Tax=Dactylosporangium darangshiense TaxID=579108 RepID=UPI0031E6BD5F